MMTNCGRLKRRKRAIHLIRQSIISIHLFVLVSGRTHDTLASLCTLYQVLCSCRPTFRQGSRSRHRFFHHLHRAYQRHHTEDALPSDVRQTNGPVTFWCAALVKVTTKCDKWPGTPVIEQITTQLDLRCPMTPLTLTQAEMLK